MQRHSICGPFLFTPGPGSGLFCLHQAQAQAQEPNINRNRCVGSSRDRVGFYAEIQINIGTVYCKIGGSDIVLLRFSKQGIWLPIRFIFTSFFHSKKSSRFSFLKITWTLKTLFCTKNGKTCFCPGALSMYVSM